MNATADKRKIVSPVNVEKRQEIDIRSGDTVRVVVKIPEGENEYRLQPFEGIVLSRKHGSEPGATFTVRREIGGIGVEKIFPLYSPRIDEIKIVRRARMRRSKLYYIRDKAARQIRRQMRKMVNVDISTKTEAEESEDSEDSTENDSKNTEKNEVEANEGEPTSRSSESGEDSKRENDEKVEDKSDDDAEEKEGES